MKEGSFENSIKLSNIFLKCAGIEIFSKKERGVVYSIKSWIFYINLTVLGPAILGELLWLIEGFYTGKGLDELCMCAPCFTVCLLAVTKINCLYFNRDIVKNVIDNLRSIHPITDEGEMDDAKNEKRTVNNALGFLKKFMMCFVYSCVPVVIVFSTVPVLSMVYDYINVKIIVYKLPFRIEYFVQPTTMFQWTLMYLHQIYSMLVVTVDVLGADLLFYSLCTYLQIHFRLLCYRFENFVSNSVTESREKFRMAVRRHQKLIELVEQIELLYSKSTLCNIILSSLLICLSGFIVTFVNDVGAVFSFVAFLVMNLTQISLLCYFGEMINSASSRVTVAIYNSKWYEADLEIKKSVVLALIRAQKPCKLTAMKFADLNLNALSAILRTAWSYFALLKTMFD